MLGRNNKGMRTRIHVKLHLHLWREWIRKKDASINRKKTCSPFNCASLFKRGRGLRGLTVRAAPKESRCCLRNHSLAAFSQRFFQLCTLRLVSERWSSSEFFSLCVKKTSRLRRIISTRCFHSQRVSIATSQLSPCPFLASHLGTGVKTRPSRDTLFSLWIYFCSCGGAHIFLALRSSFALTLIFFTFTSATRP